MKFRRSLRIAGSALAAVIVLAACSDSPDEAAPAADDEADAPAVETQTLVASSSTGLGDVLVDEDGYTLYAFLNDGPGVSNCYDQCAANWPPLTYKGAYEVEVALDQARFGPVARTDGGEQLALDGRPLYRFSGDQNPGETNGQGVNGKWFVVDAAGNLNQTQTLVAASTTGLGDVLVDADGYTLYAFLNDGPGVSNCYDQCAASWPPLTVDGAFAVDQPLDQARFAPVARNDGGQQLALDGRPLYRFSGDQNPGETNGQGVNGKWFVVDPAGNLIQTG